MSPDIFVRRFLVSFVAEVFMSFVNRMILLKDHGGGQTERRGAREGFHPRASDRPIHPRLPSRLPGQ